MSSSTAGGGATNSGGGQALLFEQDDEETRYLLITAASSSSSASTHDEQDMKKRLSGLADRFRDDFAGTSDREFWDSMSQSAKELGFREEAQWQQQQQEQPQSSSSSSPSPSSIPAAFETESGKKHIRATCSLLRISETRAVQLTLSALCSLNSPDNGDATSSGATTTTTSSSAANASSSETQQHHLASLLGTRDLLMTVRDFHYAQRLSRLHVITQCLGIEQQDDNDNEAVAPYKSAATAMLNDLDQGYMLDGRQRGLFQTLLCVACAPCAPPTRDELLPSLELRCETPETLQQAQFEYANASQQGGGSAADASSSSPLDNKFVTNCFQACRFQTQRERLQAMEALLVLLYHRIQKGIYRIDYALILLSFESCGTFFTSIQEQYGSLVRDYEGIIQRGGERHRLSYLAGLICAECMSLWMTNSTDTDMSGLPLWISRHPLLQSLVVDGNERAIREMEALVLLLTKYANQVPARKLASLAIRTPAPSGATTEVQAPESIALYSFAILLRLVQIHMPRQESLLLESHNHPRFDFEKHAMECAHMADDQGGVFDYLQATMEALVKTPIRDSFSSVCNMSYDWQFSSDSPPLVLEGASSEQDPLNTASVAYSSIALELLSSTIIGFQSTIRSGNSISLQNVTMLCSLAATICGNHPILCKVFWENLEAYTSEVTPRQNGSLTSNEALCYLVDAAHGCATCALNAVAFASTEQHPGLEEVVLPSLIPLLQLTSSLCSNSGNVESVLALLPEGMIRVSLLCCASTKVKDATDYAKNVRAVLEALQSLTRVGCSSTCRTKLRGYLEEKDSNVVDGPRILYRIIAAQQSADIVSSALRIMGYFVEDTGGHELWVAKAAKHFGPTSLGENRLSALLTGQSSSVALSALHVLNGFVSNMATVAFCPACQEVDILDVLAVSVKGVTSACMLLTTLLSSSSSTQTPQAVDGLTFLAAHGILRCASIFLREIRPINYMHASLRVKESGKEGRDILIQTLATSTPIGQAIAYFASAPVLLSLAIALENMLRNASVFQIASDEYSRESESLDFGAWRSVADASRENKPAMEVAKVRLNGESLVSNLHKLVIDVQGFQTRGWTDEATATEPLQAASAALDLLRLWSVTVDEIIAEKHGIRSGSGTSLSQAAASDLRLLSPSRLIFSQLERPPVVDVRSGLRNVWPTEMICLFNVLLRYLDGTSEGNNENVSSSDVMPSLVAADVVSLSLTRVKELGKSFEVPVTDVVIRCAPQLCPVLAQSIMSAAAISSAKGQRGGVSQEDGLKIREGLASLRVLSICMELDDRVVFAMCACECSPLDGMVGVLNATASSIRDVISLGRISVDALQTSQLRITSGSIHALLPLWRSTCTRIAGQAGVSANVDAVKKQVLSDLITIVEFAAKELPATDAHKDPQNTHLISILTASTSEALEILAVELRRATRDTPEANTEVLSMVGDMMKTSFSSLSDALSEASAVVTTARCWSSMESTMKSYSHVSVHDPRSVLCSFLAAYRSPMGSHDTQENLCDVVAASNWPSPLYKVIGTSGEGSLKVLNASLILLTEQLNLASSWARFATFISTVEGRGQATFEGRALSGTRSLLAALGHVATNIEEAQMLVAENYLPIDVGYVAYALSGLLGETIGRISSASRGTSSLEAASIIEMLESLSNTTEKLLSSTCVNRPSCHVISLIVPSYLLGVDMLQDINVMCCIVQRRLLASASLIFSTLDEYSSSSHLSQKENNRLADVALKFVEAACKGLELALSLSRPDLTDGDSDDLYETAVSFLTVLFSRERGSAGALTGDSLFYKSAAAAMKKFDVMQSLVVKLNVASKSAVGTPSAKVTTQSGESVLKADDNQVRLVQTILSFVRTIAEVGQMSNEILSLLDSADLSKMIVDNPLFISANEHWLAARYGAAIDHGQRSVALRGYIPLKNGQLPVDLPESRTIVTGTFLSGRDDPVHIAWRTALKILQAIVNASTEQRGTLAGLDRPFLDAAIAFLKTYYSSLVACLEQCSSLSVDRQREVTPGMPSAAHVSNTVLTFNALCETRDILALIVPLCKGAQGRIFENVCKDIYRGLTGACRTVVYGLSKFLAAAGTAKELFAALKDYDLQLQQENGNRDHNFRFGFNEAQFDISPLLSAGVPNAKHEAIKHAHYANRCCAYVTLEDYKDLPSGAETPVYGPSSTSSLERDSQVSMNSPFMLRMEHAAAECVSTAVTVLSETHPASNCFVVFSVDELHRTDMLQLLREGMIVSSLPEPSNRGGICPFSRILHVDTVRRICQVSFLDGTGSQPAQGSLPVDRINGLEDVSKRMPILAFSAAPSSFSEFEADASKVENTASLGDVIMTLRWCYQCTDGAMDSHHRKSVRKALAESAAALLCTEISLHEAIRTFSIANRDELSKRVLGQLLELFDDSQEAPRWSGRLKEVIGRTVWEATQQQLADELTMAREDRAERRMESLKRTDAMNGSSPWYNASRQQAEARQPLRPGLNFGAS